MWPLLSLGAAALVAFGFILGQVLPDEESEVSAPETLAMQDPTCVGLNVLVERLLNPQSGNITSELVSDLKDELPTELHDDADSLITLYSALEAGDLTALADAKQMSEAEQAAAEINNHLATECGLDPTTSNSVDTDLASSDD